MVENILIKEFLIFRETTNSYLLSFLMSDYVNNLYTEYCWIVQSGLFNPDCNPIWWIGLWLTIQFCHFNPNPKFQNYFIKKLRFHSGLRSNSEAATFYQNIQTINLSKGLHVDKRCLLGIPWFHHKTWPFHIWCPISFFQK